MTLDTSVAFPDAPAVPAVAAKKASSKQANKRASTPIVAPIVTAQSNAQKSQPEKTLVRTLLVASCGWPTDADLPRKRAGKR